MFASPLLDRATRALRRLPFLLAATSVLALAACGDDDDDGPSGPSGVTGTWQLDSNYLRITSTEVQFFTDLGECYARVDAAIVDRDGATYTLEVAGNQFEFEIRRSGDNLIFSDGEEELVFEPSSADVENLEICTTPELPACNTLPELEFGVFELHDLESSAPVDEYGAHYDLYRITIDGSLPDPVAVAMAADFDTYLYVFDASGNIVGENDDWEGVPNESRIDLSEPDGCYIVKASSYAAAVTGGYEIGFF